MRRATLPIVALALLASLTACVADGSATNAGYVSGDGTVTTWEVEDRSAPVDLTGTTFDGDQLDVASYRGQVLVITTWYAACPPCRAEAPDLEAVDGMDDVSVIGINNRDDAGTAQAFQRRFGVTFPSIDDSEGAAIAALQGLVALNAVPTTLVIDPEGRVAARIIGQADPSTLASLVADAARIPVTGGVA